MDGVIKEIKINRIVNYFENPRHAVGTTEEDTLKKLFEAVGNQFMLNLAGDIQEHGLIGSQQIVVVYSEELKKYVVYEGNRRVAAIKMLLDPEKFTFLDKPTIEKAKKIAQEGVTPSTLKCYITDEAEAMFIMERVHSGEDKGRGVKQWTSREKEVFKVRRSHEKKKTLSYLIDFYVRKYCDGLDITTIIPFTTIQRLFNNHDVRKQIGLDITHEETFTPEKMRLIVSASKWVTEEAKSKGVAVTRLCNTANAIEKILLPWVKAQMDFMEVEPTDTEVVSAVTDKTTAQMPQSPINNSSDITPDVHNKECAGQVPGSNLSDISISHEEDRKDSENISKTNITGSGSEKNLPYFFQGLEYEDLNPNIQDAHGVAALCNELKKISDKKLVKDFPIASAFLVRALIEQSIVYYAKTHMAKGENKAIWEHIQNKNNLGQKIDNFKSNLEKYFPDKNIRQYFNALFGHYEDVVDPLNWVVHRPSEFQLDPTTLIELPRKGLLTLINYMLSNN